MEEPDGGLGEHPRDRGALMRPWLEGAREAGEGEPLALGAVVAQHDCVEAAVVLAGEPAGAVGVLPAPLAEALLQGLGFLLGGGGLGRVDHAAAVVGFVGDLDRALLEHGLGQRRGGHPLGSPHARGLHAPAAALDRPHRPARMLHLDVGVFEDLG